MARFAAILLFLALAGPAAADEIARSTIAFEGRERTYYLDVPDRAQSGPVPLVVLLHGSGGNGLFMAQQWKDIAAREGHCAACAGFPPHRRRLGPSLMTGPAMSMP